MRMVVISKPTPCMNFMVVSGTGVPNVIQTDSKQHEMSDLIMHNMYKMEVAKEQKLFQLRYSVVVMCQCKWDKLEKEDKNICALTDSLRLVETQTPRHFLGWENQCHQGHQASPSHHGQCLLNKYDFTSLYPWTNKNCIYPVGHPTVIYEWME